MKLTPGIGQRFQFGGFLMSKYLLKTKLEAVDLYQRGFSTKEIQKKFKRNYISHHVNLLMVGSIIINSMVTEAWKKAFLRQDIVVNLN